MMCVRKRAEDECPRCVSLALIANITQMLLMFILIYVDDMGIKDIKTLSYTLCDMDTGLVVESGVRDYDFRFKSERANLHDLLDGFIVRLRNGSVPLSFELQLHDHPVQLTLPF